MELRSRLIVLAAASALLSACNTTDALIPRVGVGEDSEALASSPVTQSEAEDMASQGSRQKRFASTPSRYHSAYNARSYESRNYEVGGDEPQRTLERQAAMLDKDGTNSEASAPLDDDATGAVSQSSSQTYSSSRTLAAMQRGQSDFPSRQSEQAEADRRLNDPTPARQATPAEQALAKPAASFDTIRFLPIIGAPVKVVTPLSRQLGADARARGLTIKGSGDRSTALILKGYLSAFEDGPAITVSYVWDILDSSGNRMHRIQGTESAPLKKGDPWAAVPDSVMQTIAHKTIDDLAQWRSQQAG